METLQTKVDDLTRLYEEELEKNSRLRDKYMKLKGGGVKLDSEFWMVEKTIEELNYFRNQIHSDATDIFEDDERFAGVDRRRQHEILFEVFVFAYRLSVEKLKRLGEVMKLDEPRVRGPMMALIQENFELYLDVDEVKREYLAWVAEEKQFDPIEREYLELENVMSEYLCGSAKLCWVIVLTTSPQLELKPLDYRVEFEKVPFNDDEFILAPGKHLDDCQDPFVTQVLLPGIARRDTGKWADQLAKPWVDVFSGEGCMLL